MISAKSASLVMFGPVALALALIVLRGDGGDDALATGPAPPADCYLADEPSPDGPAAPSDLRAHWSPYFEGHFLVDAYDVVSWQDNSDDETCFVLEMAIEFGAFEPVIYSFPNGNGYQELSGYGTRRYRVYAATANARSVYSNVGEIVASRRPWYLTQGDTNCDGHINGADALGPLKAEVGFDPIYGYDCPYIGVKYFGYSDLSKYPWGDINCDDLVGLLDTFAILHVLAALPYEREEPCIAVGVTQDVTDFD